jgi:hypothetical protein
MNGFPRIIATVATLAIVAFGSTSRLSATAGPLDGKTFVAQTGEQGKPGEAKDTLVFRDGKMRSTACDAYGFGEGAYTSMSHPGMFMVHARTESAKEGVIVWNCTVRGDALDGTYVWSKPGQKDITYWIKGTLKK